MQIKKTGRERERERERDLLACTKLLRWASMSHCKMGKQWVKATLSYPGADVAISQFPRLLEGKTDFPQGCGAAEDAR